MTSTDPRPSALQDSTGKAEATSPLHPRKRSSRIGAFVALTKPRIIELLLVTTLPTMILAERGMPPITLVLLTLVGGALAAGSANVLNCYVDRDIDAVMGRTKRRPLVTGEVSPAEAMVFGLVLGALSIAWFAVLVNFVAAWLTLAAILLYVVFYTIVLKRRTSQNIVWGGAAGCMPVLIGWSAVTGGLDWAALVLFGIIFLWTPPHYWPLSMRFREDYAAAGVPMLPVVAGEKRVASEMVAYAVAMVACSLILIPVGGMGWGYTVIASLSGVWFVYVCVRLYRLAVDPEQKGLASRAPAMKVFHASITYLTIVFAAIAVDPFLPW